MQTMTALFNQKYNEVRVYPIYQGDTLNVWQDIDSNDLYFCQNANGEQFELTRQEVIDIFGHLPQGDKPTMLIVRTDYASYFCYKFKKSGNHLILWLYCCDLTTKMPDPVNIYRWTDIQEIF